MPEIEPGPPLVMRMGAHDHPMPSESSANFRSLAIHFFSIEIFSGNELVLANGVDRLPAANLKRIHISRKLADHRLMQQLGISDADIHDSLRRKAEIMLVA